MLGDSEEQNTYPTRRRRLSVNCAVLQPTWACNWDHVAATSNALAQESSGQRQGWGRGDVSRGMGEMKTTEMKCEF